LFIYADSPALHGMVVRVRVLGFGGSLRKGSYSTAVMRAAARLAPEGVEVELFERLGEFPPFNADLEGSAPRVVADFKARIRAADAILIATPEYNYSVPGYLKNAMDWASRPYGDNSFQGKPAAILSSSTGSIGGARAQYHMRQSFVFLDMHPINTPECIIGHAKDKVDANGAINDPDTEKKIAATLNALAAFTRQLKAGRSPTAGT
jgi:chromate reductase, NAD(P)H dehydrogenase (quinone)